MKAFSYQGILLFVDKSGINLISPTPVNLDSSAGPSVNEGIPIEAKVKPTPFL